MGSFIERAREAEAVVTGVVYEGGKKARIHPVVRFQSSDGREIVVASQQHHNVQPGQTVRIVYDPAKPEDLEIGTLARVGHRRIVFTTLALLIGLVVCTLGVAVDPNTLRWRL
jgi:hypothetical protein